MASRLKPACRFLAIPPAGRLIPPPIPMIGTGIVCAAAAACAAAGREPTTKTTNAMRIESLRMVECWAAMLEPTRQLNQETHEAIRSPMDGRLAEQTADPFANE